MVALHSWTLFRDFWMFAVTISWTLMDVCCPFFATAEWLFLFPRRFSMFVVHVSHLTPDGSIILISRQKEPPPHIIG